MTALISGDIAQAIEAIGAREQDPAAQRVLGLASNELRVDTVVEVPDERWTLYVSADEGFDVRFLNGVLEQVTFHMTAGPQFAANSRTRSLIEGLDLATATREDVLEAMPKPSRSTERWDKFSVGGTVVHIGYDGGRVRSVVVMARRR